MTFLQSVFSALSQYDRMFRYQIAYKHNISWDKIDDEVYYRYVNGANLRNSVRCRFSILMDNALMTDVALHTSIGFA